MREKQTDIIVPSWNQIDAVLTCLESVRYYSRDYTLIFVDNGSDPELFKEVEEELQKHEYKLIKNYRNLGFIKAINQGLSVATSDYVVLLNNDTEVTKDWLAKLHYPFTQHPKIAAVGPVTNAKDCWQGQHPVADSWMLCKQTTMLAFFCVMLKRSAVEDVGLLDEQFGVGLGDDDDYCRRLHLGGYRIALAENCYIYHSHRSTFNALYTPNQLAELTEKGLELFRNKHGVDRQGNKVR